MSGSLFMPLWTDAYLGDTRHLSTVQHGAYLLLLMAMWRNAGYLPNDERRLARTAGLSLDKWRKISPEVMEFFEVVEGSISQKRLRLELEKSLGLAQKRALAGSAGGRAKSLKNNKSDVANATADAQQNPSLQYQYQYQYPCSESNDSESPHPSDGSPHDDFVAPWEDEAVLSTRSAEAAGSSSKPKPKPKPEPKPKPATPRGSRLPADWQPNESYFEEAEKVGMPRSRAEVVAGSFRDYWISKAGREAIKLDWLATWRNWCRKEVERNPGMSQAGKSHEARSRMKVPAI